MRARQCWHAVANDARSFSRLILPRGILDIVAAFALCSPVWSSALWKPVQAEFYGAASAQMSVQLTVPRSVLAVISYLLKPDSNSCLIVFTQNRSLRLPGVDPNCDVSANGKRCGVLFR